METEYYREYSPTEITLKIDDENRGIVSKAEMHITTISGADINLNLLGPKLTSDIHSDLTELSCNLTEIRKVQIFRELRENGTLKSRIEIERENGNRESIRCKKINGVPT